MAFFRTTWVSWYQKGRTSSEFYTDPHPKTATVTTNCFHKATTVQSVRLELSLTYTDVNSVNRSCSC